MKNVFDDESDYLPPLFDLSDAPILDFSTPLVSDDPSALISKVRLNYVLFSVQNDSFLDCLITQLVLIASSKVCSNVTSYCAETH